MRKKNDSLLIEDINEDKKKEIRINEKNNYSYNI